MPDKELTHEELDQQLAAELPDRRMMTLINTDPAMLATTPDTTGGTGGLDGTTAGTTDPVVGTATHGSDLAQSQVPATDSGTASVVSADRSDIISQQDSAYAGPE